jgi:hypothetical protein
MKEHFDLAKEFGALFLSCVVIGACVGLALASAYTVVKLVVGVVQ